MIGMWVMAMANQGSKGRCARSKGKGGGNRVAPGLLLLRVHGSPAHPSACPETLQGDDTRPSGPLVAAPPALHPEP